MIYTTKPNNNYSEFSHTSAAAPMVSGTVALLLSIDDNLHRDDVENILEKSSVDVTEDASKPDQTFPGYDQYSGHGRINAGNAVELLHDPYVLTHHNATGGSSQKLTNDQQIVLRNDADISGLLADGTYYADKYQVTKTVNLPSFKCPENYVWTRTSGATRGWSDDNPNNEMGYSYVVSRTATTVTLRTFVYFVEYDGSSREINEWHPCRPENVEFTYTTLGVPGDPLPDAIVGSGPLCSSGKTFSLNRDLPSGAIVDWSASPSSLFTNDDGSGSSFSTAWDQNDRGAGTITATIATNDCDTVNITKKVHVGPPTLNNVEIIGEYCGHPSPFPCIYYYGERYGVKLDGSMEGITQGYEWSGYARDIHSYCGSTGASFIPNNLGPPHYGSGYIQVVGQNQCGDSYPVQTGYGPCQRATSSGEYYTLSPNPADESTEVSTKESTETRTQDGATTETFEPGQIKIYDKSGIVVRVIDYNTSRQRINTSSMDEGIYIVEISTPKPTEKLRLMVEH